MKTHFKGQGMLIPLLLFTLCLHVATLQVHAQQQVVQFSGLVTSSDSLQNMAGASVYVPNTTRGVQTTGNGFFSLPVLPGDSVVISMLGYQKQYIIIPLDYSNQSYATHIQLQESATELPTVDVMLGNGAGA
ncbi:carboxypeptidase-like regulatory domain-containing protein [Pontibacter diazotrophicus]|uniref:Carboxypeptidase-like regulatory domain-containing protein n=1 Tax=Pontibacter diazotrophicus TaxID=1400979 RepID=A0A3D8LCK5_9BACT|nr:carboxypeptidase-like regulatory domain-containing protein [Pontibacter diazotrophicus]RDV15138.1 carboxypeptidase-like regulatory domain-containing protein [Pontibacter diazotrophicus]